jgi:hypothetical protein
LAVAEPVKKWHGHQNKILRDGDHAAEWLVSQIADAGYIKHIEEILLCLRNFPALETCGFFVTRHSMQMCTNGETLDEDHHADLYGQLVLHMCAARLRRGLWLFGWPLRMTTVLKGGDAAAAVVRDFREDNGCSFFRMGGQRFQDA